RREVGREGLHQVASHERQVEKGPDARELGRDRLDNLLLARRASQIFLARIEAILPDARVDQRALAVHMLWPLLEMPAVPRTAFGVVERAIELVRPDGLGH